jgi:hypothetical protein
VLDALRLAGSIMSKEMGQFMRLVSSANFFVGELFDFRTRPDCDPQRGRWRVVSILPRTKDNFACALALREGPPGYLT